MKICQILLVPALLLAFIKQANASSGCDLDSNIADGCSGLTSCTLSNGYATGSCCNSSNLCDIDEGDCDADSDCDGDLICGSNNCASPFPDTHDCCTRACSNYISSVSSGKMTWGTLTVEFSEDVTSWTMEVTFDTELWNAALINFSNAVTNLNCSGYTCTFDNRSSDWGSYTANGEQSAGDTIDISFSYDSTSAIITDVSITSESTPFCTS